MAQSLVLRTLFGARVGALLIDLELESEALARLVDLPVTRIDKILTGRLVRITLDDMSRIACAFGVPLHDLLCPTPPAASIVAGQEIEEG